ncbi:subtilisin-like protease [Metarhizium album ARSEF 1941]|uniref:Subtilisin-like protease n=1 Tax=Metarhizium album (strain ARSEF 1941) TaxID=1081103 RepID=A0A0B2WP31_METAS|nr:subtilisin-like protease [Metarhizium album ARSEF 1941]KHN94735.1 subtilisin-like protease [Metarhizium album ARSEF 1941]
MHRIQINGNARPVAGAVSAASISTFAAPPPSVAHSNYILIQAKGPLSAQQKQALRDKQVDVLEYQGEDVYRCGYKPTSLEPVTSDLPDFITDAEVYHPDYVVEPELKTDKDDDGAEVEVAIHDDVGDDDVDRVASDIATQADIPGSSVRLQDRKACITVSKVKLGQLARIDEVKAINEVQTRRLLNNVACGIVKAHEPVGAASVTYKGKGQVRPPCREWNPDGHGTHVCGSVLGDGNHGEEGRIEAPASEAKLIMQSLFDKLDKRAGPNPQSEGATVHTNPWGGPPQLYVEREEAKIDGYLWGNKAMTVLFAAGNAGVGVDSSPGHVDAHSLSAQAVCKNVISIGANRRPDVKSPVLGNKPLVIAVDNVADNPEGMAAFSSRGPTQPDGRIKPDIVAPGTTILSTRSSHMVPGHHSESWGHSSDAGWMYEGGTSMATPLVAGCCAVVRGALFDNRVAQPSAALVKAILINGAVPLKGQYGQGLPDGEFWPSVDAPNPNSGFGRVNLASSLRSIVAGPESRVCGFEDVTGDQSLGMDGRHREEHAVAVDIPTGGSAALTLKVTLVWTDFPGERLPNDLDLIVAGAGGEKHGNQGDDLSAFDRMNNVEQVVWRNVELHHHHQGPPAVCSRVESV